MENVVESSDKLTQNVTDKMNDLVNWLDTAAKTSSSFISEQTPLFITEYLNYNFWVSFIWFCVAVVVLIGAITASIIFFVKGKKDRWYNENNVVGFWICCLIALFMFAPLSFNSDWIKIKLAPRVYIVEHIKELIR